MKTIRADWADVLLVCGKCSKKLDGGFGPKGKTSLGKALRRAFGAKQNRKAALGIVDVRCLGVCPKGAVTLIDGAVPHVWKLVPAGMPIETLLRAISLDRDAEPEPVSAGSPGIDHEGPITRSQANACDPSSSRRQHADRDRRGTGENETAA